MYIHVHTLDSFLTCAPRNRPRNRCNYASRNLLFLIVDFSILSSFHRIVEKPRMKLESLISLPLGWRTPASICPQFLERIHGSMIRRQEEEISVWLTTHRDQDYRVYTPAPWNCEYHRLIWIDGSPPLLISINFLPRKGSNEDRENRAIFNTMYFWTLNEFFTSIDPS